LDPAEVAKNGLKKTFVGDFPVKEETLLIKRCTEGGGEGMRGREVEGRDQKRIFSSFESLVGIKKLGGGREGKGRMGEGTGEGGGRRKEEGGKGEGGRRKKGVEEGYII
jgi:hypothetical protein